MPKFNEKYIFNNINKDLGPGAVSSDGQRKLTPGTAVEVRNARILAKEEGKIGSIPSIKGNQRLVNGNLPTGTNQVVGAFEDIEENSIIFFVYNASGNHSIHRYTPDTNTFTELIEWTGLGFTGKPIKGIGKVGSNLYWTDGSYPKNIDLDQLSVYGFLEKEMISLYKTPPLTPPTIEFGTDTTKTSNRVCEDSFQFAYRYIYNDDTYSRLSPLSKSLPAKLNPNTFDSTDNYINVTISVDSEIKDLIKKIELYYVVNNEGDYIFFNEIKSPTTTSYSRKFYNDYQGPTLATSEKTSNENIPVESSCLAFFKDRLFLTNNKNGLDVNDGSIAVALENVELPTREGLHFKKNGTYTFGIKLSDSQGRSSLVRKVGTLNFNSPTGSTSSGVPISNSEYAKLTLSGTAPPWATRYQLVMTKESKYQTYAQFMGYMLFASVTEEELEGTGYTPPSGTYFKYVNRYFVREVDGIELLSNQLIHIMFPVGLAVVPKAGMYIRTISNNGIKFVKKILGVEGSRIIIELRENETVNNSWDSTDRLQFFEIFELKKNTEELFYEIGESHTIPSNKVISSEHILEGDTYIKEIELKTEREDSLDKLTTGFINYNPVNSDTFRVETPTPTYTHFKDTPDYNVYQDNLGATRWVLESQEFVLDYSKSANHFGQAFPLQKENSSDQQPNRLSFSNTYIQDSFINGLANFDSSNQRSIPNELSKITALIPVGGNIMLAVHERECSSISVGDGFIKTGDVDNILIKTEGVIGDDRQLLGSRGTIFPGSIQSHDGKVFFFDIYKGSVVRYTVAGLFPISDYGMASHFKALADAYLPYKDQVNIVAGIDNFNDEYIITFPPIGELSGETWAFNYNENRWTSRYDFLPDYYGKVGNRLFTFKNGELWEHNKTETHNNFYGVQYERKITFYANPYVTINKRLMNVHLNIDELSNSDDDKVVIIKTPNGQETYLKKKHFDKQEYTYYAPLLKDINTNVESGKLALREGKDMRDKYFEVTIITNSTNANFLHEVTLVFVDSQYSR